MIELSQSVVIARPPADVFAHLSQPDRYGAWLPGIKSVSVMSGDAVGAGTPLSLLFEGPGDSTISATGTVTDFVPPERIGLRAQAKELRFNAVFELTPTVPDGSSTTVSLAVRLELLGLYRFGEGMVRKRAPGELEEALGRLKSAVES